MCVHLKNVQQSHVQIVTIQNIHPKSITRREERSTKMCMASASSYLNRNPILDAAQCQKVEKHTRNMPKYETEIILANEKGILCKRR